MFSRLKLCLKLPSLTSLSVRRRTVSTTFAVSPNSKLRWFKANRIFSNYNFSNCFTFVTFGLFVSLFRLYYTNSFSNASAENHHTRSDALLEAYKNEKVQELEEALEDLEESITQECFKKYKRKKDRQRSFILLLVLSMFDYYFEVPKSNYFYILFGYLIVKFFGFL